MNDEEVCAILARADRRRVIRELLENDGASSLEAIARAIAARGDVPDRADAEALERAKVDLVHDHLPRLEDHGLIEYDGGDGNVRLLETDSLESISGLLLDGGAPLHAGRRR